MRALVGSGHRTVRASLVTERARFEPTRDRPRARSTLEAYWTPVSSVGRTQTHTHTQTNARTVVPTFFLPCMHRLVRAQAVRGHLRYVLEQGFLGHGTRAGLDPPVVDLRTTRPVDFGAQRERQGCPCLWVHGRTHTHTHGAKPSWKRGDAHCLGVHIRLCASAASCRSADTMQKDKFVP